MIDSPHRRRHSWPPCWLACAHSNYHPRHCQAKKLHARSDALRLHRTLLRLPGSQWARTARERSCQCPARASVTWHRYLRLPQLAFDASDDAGGAAAAVERALQLVVGAQQRRPWRWQWRRRAQDWLMRTLRWQTAASWKDARLHRWTLCAVDAFFAVVAAAAADVAALQRQVRRLAIALAAVEARKTDAVAWDSNLASFHLAVAACSLHQSLRWRLQHFPFCCSSLL